MTTTVSDLLVADAGQSIWEYLRWPDYQRTVCTCQTLHRFAKQNHAGSNNNNKPSLQRWLQEYELLSILGGKDDKQQQLVQKMSACIRSGQYHIESYVSAWDPDGVHRHHSIGGVCDSEYTEFFNGEPEYRDREFFLEDDTKRCVSQFCSSSSEEQQHLFFVYGRSSHRPDRVYCRSCLGRDINLWLRFLVENEVDAMADDWWGLTTLCEDDDGTFVVDFFYSSDIEVTRYSFVGGPNHDAVHVLERREQQEQQCRQRQREQQERQRRERLREEEVREQQERQQAQRMEDDCSGEVRFREMFRDSSSSSDGDGSQGEKEKGEEKNDQDDSSLKRGLKRLVPPSDDEDDRDRNLFDSASSDDDDGQGEKEKGEEKDDQDDSFLKRGLKRLAQPPDDEDDRDRNLFDSTSSDDDDSQGEKEKGEEKDDQDDSSLKRGLKHSLKR